jgi:hypothetical protein
MEDKNWKFIAIGFMVSTIIFLAIIIWAIFAGTAETAAEYECMFEVCNDEKFVAYNYESYSKLCQCYELNNDRPTVSKVIK